MTDGIIKGTGNSRYLRGPANIRTLYPTYDDLLDALAAGTFPIDLNGINPAGWETVGNKLDKATLLTDALCTALGLATTATPTQAMDKLRQLVATAQGTANGRVQIATGSYAGENVTSKSLVFNFLPILVIVTRNAGTGHGNHLFLIRGQTQSTGIAPGTNSGAGYEISVSFSDKTVKWSSAYPVQAMNANSTYYYIAIG